MKSRNLKDLRSAIERNEALYLTLDNYSLRQQVWQTLVYLRSILKDTKRARN
jgi:hypothetical protein